jgi:hypothetical protein
MANAMQSNNNGQIIMPVYLDGVEIARHVYDINETNNIRGGAF